MSDDLITVQQMLESRLRELAFHKKERLEDHMKEWLSDPVVSEILRQPHKALSQTSPQNDTD